MDSAVSSKPLWDINLAQALGSQGTPSLAGEAKGVVNPRGRRRGKLTEETGYAGSGRIYSIVTKGQTEQWAGGRAGGEGGRTERASLGEGAGAGEV